MMNPPEKFSYEAPVLAELELNTFRIAVSDSLLREDKLAPTPDEDDL